MKKEKILFLNGQFEKNFYEPAGLLFIVSYLRSLGERVDVIDPTIDGKLNENDILDYVIKNKIKIIGISILFSSNELSKRINDLCNKLKNINKDLFIFIGGIGVSSNPTCYLKNKNINAICIGEGEKTVEELIYAYRNGDILDDIPGVLLREGQELKKRKFIENLDELPFMARDCIDKRIDFYGREFIRNSIFVIYAGRGCIGSCSFCSLHNVSRLNIGKIYRERSLESVINEIKMLNDKYGAYKFIFWDECLLLPGKKGIEKAHKLADLISKLNFSITFSFQTRPDTITEEAIKSLQRVGLRDIFIGIENCDKDELLIFNKNINKIYEPLDILYKCGFKAEPKSKFRLRIGTIIFTPYTTIKSFLNNVKLFERYTDIPIKKLSTKVSLLEGTDLRNKVIEDGLLYKETEFKFKDNKIEILFNSINNIINTLEKTRRRIRDLEKASKILNVNNYREDLYNYRIILDSITRKEIFNITYKLEPDISDINYIITLEQEAILKIKSHINNMRIINKLDDIEKDIQSKNLNIDLMKLGNINSIIE
ncbi:B12-binding domain-containing radical SAM protein [Clostridium sp.]|uniref:B12-binding domain-containing radical SAM protein n=1 Tax=Clostridium sp. TaxID=1506 RepID=UPI003F2C17DE